MSDVEHRSPKVRTTLRRPLAALIAFATFVVGVTGLSAAPLQRNLGEGLMYFRLHTVPGDLPNDDAVQQHPVVLDLRYAKSDAAGASVLAGWLKFHASAQHPLFVLLNPSTSPALVGMLQDHEAIPGLLTLGAATAQLAPDLTVTTSSRQEKQAYDALEAGTSVVALTTDNPDKLRNDEASLAHDRTPEPTTAGDDTLEPDAPVKARPPVIIDYALQRAIQVYRGLKTLKVVDRSSAK